ncbi:holo-ACP synthase [Corynebacterium sp.]|uniref:holo-ACP synthase AcpS n=1 Tax=Corynebacterium sp. TaxID=1720 RepID=UPI0026DD5C82|nr:holo-ACP synthase [Corynebacterium sp.]MDO5076200.1 holo-ACP synthase [Corynebacterium sp.]
MDITLGTDLVHIPGFAEQLAQPGSKFAAVFSAAELRRAKKYTGRRRAEHLAGRWAAKEAFIKAWSQACYGKPPVLAQEAVTWSEIEVRADAYQRVAIHLNGEIARAVADSLGHVQSSLSISHDGDYAAANVLLIRTPASRI